jgi:hypothetical protein
LLLSFWLAKKQLVAAAEKYCQPENKTQQFDVLKIKNCEGQQTD